MFIVLIVALVAGVYTYIRTYQIEHFMCILLNVSHTKIKIKTIFVI